MWLVIPNITSFQSVQGLEGLTSLSDSQCKMLARSVTSRGKLKPPQFWQRAWKTKPYMRRLSGLTYPALTASLGVDSWIASLAVTRVSQTVLPENVLEPKMTASSSTNLFGSSKKCGLRVFSEKTSRGMQTGSSNPSSQHWNNWVIALRLESSQRQRWGLPTSENDCSSWPTPDTGQGGPSAKLIKGVKIGDGGHHLQMRLVTKVKMWQTPKVARGTWQGQKDGSKKPTLRGEAVNWATPQARDHQSGEGHRWDNPARSQNLNDQVDNWPTPLCADSGEKVTVASHQNSLIKAANGFPFLHQVLMTQDGRNTSRCIRFLRRALLVWTLPRLRSRKQLLAWARRTNTKRLNPYFIEWLMGWPAGLTDYAHPVTGFARWQAQSRGYLCALILNRKEAAHD